MISIQRRRVPDLIRDLLRGLRLVNFVASSKRYGTLRLSHSLSTWWSDLHRQNRNTSQAGRSASVGSLLYLTACALPEVDPLDLPPDVESALPADIDLSEVNRDPDGCYFYVYAGDLFVVRDIDGAPICLPEGDLS